MEIVLTHLDPITVNVTLDSRGLLRSKHASVKPDFCAEKTVLWDSQQGCWSYRELTKTRHEKFKHSCIVDLFCNALGESPFQHKHCAHVEHRQCRIWLRNPSVCLLCPDNMASSSQYRQHYPSLSLRFLVIFNYCFLWAPHSIQHQIVPCLHAESHDFTLHHRHPNPTSLLVHLGIHLPDSSTSPFPVRPWVVVAWIDFCCLPLVLIALNPEILWFLSLTQHWVQTFKVFVHYALNSCVNNSTLPQPAPNLTTPHFLFTSLFF